MSASLDFIDEVGINNIYSHENKLTQYAYEKMKAYNDIKIYGDFENQTSIISFNIDGVHFNDLAMLLDKQNIAIRTGHHCAQPIMDYYKISGTIRISLSFYNTKQEIDSLIDAIIQAKKMLT